MTNADEAETELSPEIFEALDDAVTRYEEAVGYGREAMAGRLSGCYLAADEAAEAVLDLCDGIDFEKQCFCEAPNDLYPRLLHAWAVMEWLEGLVLDSCVERAEELIERDEDLRLALMDPDLGEDGITREDDYRAALALQIRASAGPATFVAFARERGAELPNFASVTGWWTAAERALDDDAFAAGYGIALCDAVLEHEVGGLTGGHVKIMRGVATAIAEAALEGRRVDRRRVAAALSWEDVAAVVDSERDFASCRSHLACRQIGPWFGVERKVGLGD